MFDELETCIGIFFLSVFFFLSLSLLCSISYFFALASFFFVFAIDIFLVSSKPLRLEHYISGEKGTRTSHVELHEANLHGDIVDPLK